MRTAQQPLSLEILEARALFAGDILDTALQLDEVMLALQSTSKINASFDPAAPAGVYRLILVGDETADVNIDFDKLPAFVTSINVSKFDSITFSGTDSLVNLIAKDVNSLIGPEISTVGFEAKNVDYIELKSVTGYATIEGNRVQTHIPGFDAINLTLNVNSLLLDADTLPKQVTVWNAHAVIALPNVPNSWDLSTFSGLEDRGAQLRLGSSDTLTKWDGVLEALQSTSAIEASIDPNAPVGVYRLMLVGDSNANVTIDFDKLPSFVTSINVSNFDSITFEGKDSLVNLIANDVNSIKAPDLSVIGFEAKNVDYVELKSVAGYAYIQGDQVEAHIEKFDAINLTLNVTSLLLDTEILPKQITLWNTKSIIALPQISNASELSTFSGIEDKSQLRLGSSDISTGIKEQGSETPASPVVFSNDLHVRTLLDRLEVLFNQAGGFDATMIKRIVAELNQVQDVAGSAVSPAMIIRRELSNTFAIEQPTSVSLSPSLNSSVEVIVDPAQLATNIPMAEGHSNNVARADDAPIIMLGSPSLPMAAGDNMPTAVHVTIDPAAEVATPQPTVWGIISQLVERGMDLKQYLIDQLTQEIVPGERGGVLLVDPKPVRGAHNPRLGE